MFLIAPLRAQWPVPARAAKLWTFTTGSFTQFSPSVANGVVYAGSDDHNVYALNAATGARLWSFATVQSTEYSPTVANGMVYTCSSDHCLYAFGLGAGIAIPARPNRNSLHADYNLAQQR